MDGRFLAYLLVMAALIVTPGPDMALTTRNALAGGARAAALTALGVAVGHLAWAAAAVVGVAQLIALSATAFTIFKLVGAAYLVGLGLLTVLRTRKPPPAPKPSAGGHPFLEGVLNNLLNPKAAAIWLTVVPQFLLSGDGAVRMLAMLAAFELILATWLLLYGRFVLAARRRIGERFERLAGAVTGAVLVGLGARLALERR